MNNEMNNEMNNQEYKDDLPLVNGGIMRLVSKPDVQAWSIFYFDSLGRRHNEHGPAINHSNRTKMWFVNGERHREDGPALTTGAGEIWYYHGMIHRFDGPAQSHFINGTKRYYIYDVEYTQERYNKIIFRMKLAINILKKRLRNKYTQKLTETNICDEKYLYSIISSYMI
jgi:hypothetical protein